jgi:ParB family chromosome partitioning protein
MGTQTRGLGRGLSALIPTSTTATPDRAGSEAAAAVLMVALTDVIPNPRQPRTAIPPETLSDLAASIREHGVIQPLVVARTRPTDRVPYQLIAGERRWRAAQMAGLSEVPVVVKEATPQQFLELALVENIQRADLHPLEEAEAYQALIADFGLNQQEVAQRVGKSRVAVANMIRLLRLPERIKALLTEGALAEGHARALLGLPDDDLMVQTAEQVVTRELTVRQTEELVRRLASASDHDLPALPEVDSDQQDDSDAPLTRQLEDAFRRALGTKVTLSRGRRGGRLVISFYSEEELQAIYERIVTR